MAGFFGLFDYTKEGPGVEKTERKKKGFFAFFEIYFRNFWNFVKIDLIYWAMSIPLFTNGMAKAGLTHIARSATREKHAFVFSDFFETVKKNWKQSLILGILNVVATAILALDVWYFWNATAADTGLFSIIGLGVALFLLVSATFMKYYVWLLTITFDLPIRLLLKNSFHFVFLNLWRNILIAVTLGVFYAALYFLAVLNPFCFVLATILLVFVLPGFKTFLVQANVFPAVKKYMIDPYYREHKGEDIEKRRALGLEISPDELPSEQPEESKSIFTDTVSKGDPSDS